LERPLIYREAADKCTNAEHFVQLAHRLRTHGLPVERQRELYALGEQKLTEPRMRLRWAEGIIQLFDDRAWAAQVYDALEDQFPDDEWGKNRLTHSRRYWLESGHKVWG